MGKMWKTVVASFYLMGFAGITTAAAISSSAADVEVRADGRSMMVESQYRLAVGLRR